MLENIARRTLEKAGTVVQRVLIALIKVYSHILSPLIGPRCRFHPTCSQYAATALRRFGALRGSYLALLRLLKCHPFHPGGVDPVPEQFGKKRGQF